MSFKKHHLPPQTGKQAARVDLPTSQGRTLTQGQLGPRIPQPTGKPNPRPKGPFGLQENNLCLWDKRESQTGAAAAQAKLDRIHCPTYSLVPPEAGAWLPVGPSKARPPRGPGGLAKFGFFAPSSRLAQVAGQNHSPAHFHSYPRPPTTGSRFSPPPPPPNNNPPACAGLTPSCSRLPRGGWGPAGVPVGKYGSRQWFYWKSCS